jgi:hypothetical protein
VGLALDWRSQGIRSQISCIDEEAMEAIRIRGVLAPVVTPLKLVRSPLARSYPRHLTLITRTTRARASYPSCVAVYPRD